MSADAKYRDAVMAAAEAEAKAIFEMLAAQKRDH
jgi:hypothetical protein